MKIYSWNVNGLRAVLNKGALQDFLAAEQPDILCLQEIKAKPAQINHDFSGYQIFYNSAERPGYSGTAILVKEGVMDELPRQAPTSCSARSSVSKEQDGPFFDALPRARWPSAIPVPRGERYGSRSLEWLPVGWPSAIPVPRGERQWSQKSPSLFLASQEGRIQILDCDHFYLVNVYTPNSKPDLSRLALREHDWDPSFLNLLQTLEKTKPIVTCGDFNAAHTEIDLARPKTNHKNAGFTDQERQGITNLVNAGFVDTFRALYPDTQRYTWWSHWGNARANNVGWRIDYFFISAALRPHLKSAAIYEQYMGSDHCPISIDLEF